MFTSGALFLFKGTTKWNLFFRHMRSWYRLIGSPRSQLRVLGSKTLEALQTMAFQMRHFFFRFLLQVVYGSLEINKHPNIVITSNEEKCKMEQPLKTSSTASHIIGRLACSKKGKWNLTGAKGPCLQKYYVYLVTQFPWMYSGYMGNASRSIGVNVKASFFSYW